MNCSKTYCELKYTVSMPKEIFLMFGVTSSFMTPACCTVFIIMAKPKSLVPIINVATLRLYWINCQNCRHLEKSLLCTAIHQISGSGSGS